MKKLGWALFCGLVLFCSGVVHAEYCVWESISGNIIEAELIYSNNREVILRKQDGEQIKVPYARLSGESRKMVGRPKGVLESGQLMENIACEQNESVEYSVYLPSGYDPRRPEKWPVLFAAVKSGQYQDRYPYFLQECIKGAEQNNWIIAIYPFSRVGKWDDRFPVGKEQFLAMVEEVLEQYPVDPERYYVAGTDEGVYLASWVTGKLEHQAKGSIFCEGSKGERSFPEPSYLLCGANSWSRSLMTSAFLKARKKQELRMMYYSGVGPEEGRVLSGINWLNAKYLRRKGDAKATEVFSEKLFWEIGEREEGDPVWAYENAVMLASIKRSPYASKAKKKAESLRRTSEVSVYLKGMEDIAKYTEKNLNLRFNDYLKTNWEESEAGQDALSYADLYRGSSVRRIFLDFSRSCIEQDRYTGPKK